MLMKKVYFYDPNTATECWGIYSSATTYFEYGVETEFFSKSEHKVEITHRYPLGQMMAEFISLDAERIYELSKMDMEARERDSVFKELFQFPLFSDSLDEIHEDDLSDSLGYFSFQISVLREFIDLCIVNPALCRDVWIDALMEIITREDELPEVVAITGITPIDNVLEWEEEEKLLPGKALNDSMAKIEALWNDPKQLYDVLFSKVTEIENIENSSLYFEAYKTLVFNFDRTFQRMIQTNTRIKKCAHCGKYFVPVNRSDTIYCDRQSPQDPSKTCKEVGARQTWKKTLKENEAAQLYRNIYMAKQMKAKRNPDLEVYQVAFERYKVESKKWKADVKVGAKTEAEYIEWLKAEKERKI